MQVLAPSQRLAATRVAAPATRSAMRGCLAPQAARRTRAPPCAAGRQQVATSAKPRCWQWRPAALAPSRRQPAPPRGLGRAAEQQLAEVQQLDALIDTLMEQKNPQQLAQTVAENLMSFDQRFWLRLATRSDAAADEETKAQLAALARVVMQLVDTVVQRTNEQLTESTSLLQDILKAAADPQTGEWELPLAPDKLEAMRAVMAADPGALDESLLAACYSWMRKASEDKLDGACGGCGLARGPRTACAAARGHTTRAPTRGAPLLQAW